MYRLQKLLSKIGICSRRSAEKLIDSGYIKVNDSIAKVGDRWKHGDLLSIKGKDIDVASLLYQHIEVIKYFKPLGEIVSRADPHNARTVFDNLPSVDGKWINVGRLDVETTGLLLFTNDGDLANTLMHPSFLFKREYIVHTDKALAKNDINQLLKGVPINNNDVGKFESIEKLDNNKYKVLLSAGKNREIRNSLNFFKIKTLKLHRTKYSFLELDDMNEGEYRYLTKEDISNFSI
jgi:23S rRNA pseudouridine2605 synthase